MDEPTSALSAAEVDVLFRVIRDLKARGVAIIYISHKLEELLQIGDRVTILRDGRIVAQDARGGIDVAWIIEKMVGRKPASLFTRTSHPIGDVLLEVERRDAAAARGRLRPWTTSRFRSVPARSSGCTG